MKCARPHIDQWGAYGCGQCVFCRIQRRRVWTHRIMLEASQHDNNAFLTLTYSDDYLPRDNSLSPRELQLFLKRLRKNSGVRFRFFACGEYGEQSERPHYHLALFGYASCEYGITRKKEHCCSTCDLVASTWGLGNILLGQLEPRSAAYIAGYVTKKLTKAQKGGLTRHPEFARMSLRPGIGSEAMHELASTLLQHNLHKTLVDVPETLQHGKKKYPIGRYLRRKLRTYIGREANAPLEAQKEQAEALRNMRKVSWETQTSLQKVFMESTLGTRINLEAKERMFKRRGIL